MSNLYSQFAHKKNLNFSDSTEYLSALHVISTLQVHGFIAWFAGGCVRDGLLGREPKDFDVATSAKPEEVEKIFPKTVAVGKSFGVIRVIEGGADTEVATFRKDGLYVDGRRPNSVELSDPLQDSARRDFTVNAFFYDPKACLIYDFQEGFADLENRILRAIGNPEERFAEDRLRILRGLRFAAELGFSIEDQTLSAIAGRSVDLASVSLERRKDELQKFFRAISRSRWISFFVKSGIAQICFLQKKVIEENWLPWKTEFQSQAWAEVSSWLIQSGSIQKLVELKDWLHSMKISKEESTFICNALWFQLELTEYLNSEFVASQMLEKTFEPGGWEGFQEWGHGKSVHSDLYNEVSDLRHKLGGVKPLPWLKSEDFPNLKGKELGAVLRRSWLAQLSGRFSSRQDILSYLS